MLIVLVGNIGTGKSTLARKLADRGCLVVSLDAITTMLHGGNYGAYDAAIKDGVYKRVHREVIRAGLLHGHVVVDDTNIDKKRRAKLVELALEMGQKACCIDFGSDVPGVGLKRRKDEPKGVGLDTWDNVYHQMWRNYEEPACTEGFEFVVSARELDTYLGIGTFMDNVDIISQID